MTALRPIIRDSFRQPGLTQGLQDMVQVISLRRYLDEFVWRFNRRHYRPATFHLILGLAAKVQPAPLSKIVSDPIDNKTKIIGLPESKPATLPKDMLHGIKTRGFQEAGISPAGRLPVNFRGNFLMPRDRKLPDSR